MGLLVMLTSAIELTIRQNVRRVRAQDPLVTALRLVCVSADVTAVYHMLQLLRVRRAIPAIPAILSTEQSRTVVNSLRCAE